MSQNNWKERIFTIEQKKECWNNAKVIEGRDPKRWRYDAVGNPVLNQLRGCFGPLCHEYDHINPFSKGGKTTIENCQILQTRANRFKSNKSPSEQELKENSLNEHLSNREMDLIELVIYGDVKKSADYK